MNACHRANTSKEPKLVCQIIWYLAKIKCKVGKESLILEYPSLAVIMYNHHIFNGNLKTK